MSSFFTRLKSSQGPATQGLTSPTKGKSNNVPLSPLEQILADGRPVRSDGDDKYFGMNNPSNTCYANSVLQCLYFSPPFRQHVLEFPLRSPTTDALDPATGNGTIDTDGDTTALPITPAQDGGKDHIANGHPVPPLQTLRLNQPNASHAIVTAAGSKETFDNRKKAIMAAGPHVRMQMAAFDQYGMVESLFTSLKDMFEAIIAQQSRMGVVVPTRLIEVLRENFDYFRPPVHHDAHEFLNLLLNDIVEQVDAYAKKTASARNPSQVVKTPQSGKMGSTQAGASWVHELFEGVLTNETRCLTCENVSQRDEVFLDLSVDLEDHSSVTSCLSRFSEEEMLSERNKFQCEKCSSLQEAEKRMKIKKLPRILSLHLKRFKWVDGGLRKLFDRVVFPFYLRIQNTTNDAENPDRLYELYAVIVHLGSTPNHGHYVSLIKTKDRGWLLFDDELVLPVDASYVRRYFGGDYPRNHACAYVLFYQETTEDAIIREQDIEDPYSKEAVLTIQGGEILPPTSPAEETPPILDNVQTALKTPTTEVPIPLTTPTAEDSDFLSHLTNPTLASPRPPSAHMPRLSSEAPTAAGSEPSAHTNERSSMDKLRAIGTAPAASSTQVQDGVKPAEKPVDKAVSKHRMFGSGSMSSRLRNKSLSLKTKPKLFGKHERTESGNDANETAVTETGAAEESATKEQQPDPGEAQKSMKHKSSRFALGRRKSANLLGQ